MSTNCDLLLRRVKDPRNPNLFSLELRLKNPNTEETKIQWRVKLPEQIRLVQPAKPLWGENTLISGPTQEVVSGWKYDISPIPETMRGTFAERNHITAELTVFAGGSAMPDICSVRLSNVVET
jgi:hypothetical protein